jgi:hypothetical protein
MTSIPFDDPRWKASPRPAKQPEVSSDKLVLVNNPKTDWWRTLERDSKDGLVYGFEVELGTGIEISAEVKIDAQDRVSGQTCSFFPTQADDLSVVSFSDNHRQSQSDAQRPSDNLSAS